MFDIDHLYLARYNYRIDKNGKLSNWMEKGTEKYYQNKLLGNMITLLTDKDSINSTFKSIDSDVDLPKSCSEQVASNESLESEPYNFGTLRAQVSVKNDFMSGKVSIGPFALNSTNHMLTSHYNVRFRPTVVTENTKIKGFSYMLDDDGNFISAWLSGYISGAVDNAKDPFLAKLNTNLFTYNMLNLLLRSGFGETAVWFCALPIIRDMSAANERSKSQYAKDQSHKGSGLSRKEFAIMLAIKKYIPESSLTAQALKKWTTSTQKSDLYDRVRAINWVEQNRELLKEFAVNPSLLNITIYGVDYSREYVQQKVFFAWKSLEKYAVALGGLVQHTKIDTRKHGKSIIEINRYLYEYNKIFDPDEPDKSIWDVRTLQNFATSTWIDQKTKSAIRLPSFVLQNYTFSANPLFINAVLEFGRSITEPGEQLSSETANKISKQLLTAVKSRYFVDYVNDHLLKRDKDGNPVETADQHIRGLLVGKNNMARRLTGIKLAIELNPAYKRLANNGLIRQLYSMTEDDPQVLHGELTEKPAFITVLDNVDSSKLSSDLLIDGWEDLLTDSDPYVRRWALDLIVYAFMTSGEFKGWSKLFKYVPASWITGELNPEEESYSDYIEKILLSNYDYSLHFDDIAANCFSDRSIVDLVPFKNADGSENFVDQNTIIKIGAAVDITEMESVKPYILVKQDSLSKNTDAYALYKCIGFKSAGEDSVLPVYIRMKKKGYSKGSNSVYEYGWDFLYRGNENRVMNEKYNIANAIKQMSSGNDIGPLSTVGTLQARYLQLAEQHVEEADSQLSNEPLLNPQQDTTHSQARTVEPGSHIATHGYQKGDPLKHPEFNYVFTENAQAYLRSQLVNSDEESKIFTSPNTESKKDSNIPSSVFTKVNPTAYVKLNVSDVNGTNQAGIRTDKKGNLTSNAYGIVVKKNLQDVQGKFVSQEGTFLDTEKDFELFTKLNSHMFDRLENSSNKVIIFPLQMALGKAALPKRFAEWLQSLLLDRFGVVSEVAKNERSDYEGYGLNVLRVEPKESNLLQDREYDWEYLEDSGYSGALEELGLPEKVRMNGGMVYRPHYDFGRIYLTDNERKFINEEITATIDGADYQPEDIVEISKYHNSGMFNINHFGEQPTDDKNMVVIPNEYKDWIDDLFDHGFVDEHDFDESGEKISKRVIDFMNFLREHGIKYVIDNLAVMRNQLDMTGRELFDSSFEDIMYNYMVSLQEEDLIGEVDNISYSYKDSRQQELFSDEDFALLNESGEDQSYGKSIGTKEAPLQIYSDGSDIKGTGNIGYGVVFEYGGKQYGLSGTELSEEVKKLSELFPNAKFSNPTMEMLALTSILECIANSGIGEHIQINQDYKGAVNYGKLWDYSEGSELRANKPWNAKEPYIKYLVRRSEDAISTILKNGGSVKINWVKGHQTSGTEQARMNDAADKYAKNRDNFNTVLDVYNARSTEHEQC